MPVVVAVAAHMKVDVRAMAAIALRARLAFWGSSTLGTGALASSVAPYCCSIFVCAPGVPRKLLACLGVEARWHGAV